jgi:hypothetical protein
MPFCSLPSIALAEEGLFWISVFLGVFPTLREFLLAIGYWSFPKRRDRVNSRRAQCW